MKLHHIGGYIQSIYLAEYPDKLLLLDGCCRADIATLEHFITRELKRPFSDLSLVVVTHMHPDHAGAAHKLRQLTGCKIAAANVDGHWYSGLDGRLMHLTDMALTWWVAGRKGKQRKNIWYGAKLKPDYKLDDQQTLPGFDEWSALAMQGHTDRDISLYHTPSRRIYVADLIVTVKGQFSPPFPLFYPARYRASLEKLKALQPASVMLAHGGEVQLSQVQCQQVIARAPTEPQTHWRSVKAKVRGYMGR
ncbi:MAG: glyoxylase-like metal-dependent hydrolase (beta-lactamase superfamily II) [Phenylobacterium sp.]|jgi:glyoxylase-like metal-dependent hydrolase (beta-lactamase superfamily II)